MKPLCPGQKFDLETQDVVAMALKFPNPTTGGVVNKKKFYSENSRLLGLIYLILGSWTIFAAVMVAAGIFHYSLFAQVLDGVVVGGLLMVIGLERI
jgi:hypothetical protein